MRNIITTLAFILGFTSIWAQPGPPSSNGAFGTNDTIGCVPHVANFVALIPNAVSYDWDFGNGASSTQQNPVAMFTTAGSYTITLDVVYADGTTDQFIRQDYIEAYANPTIDFALSSFSPCLNENELQFQNNTSGATQFLWDFDDGYMTTDSDPYHQYSISGTYNISLFATNPYGCTSDTTITRTILPVAQNSVQVNGTSSSCDSAHVFSFSASPTGLSNYNWEFSDGSQYGGFTVQHAFHDFGGFDLLLTTTDQNGCIDSTFTSSIVSVVGLTDNFTASSNIVCQYSSVTFTASAPGASNILWDFGDGNQGTGTPVTHTYQTNGQYDVTMTTTHPGGCGQTVVEQNFITVNSQPSVSLSISDTIVCVNESIQLEALHNATSNFRWTFGDGSPYEYAPVTSHQYSSPGQFNLELAHGLPGCYDTIFQTITVSQSIADFTNISFSNCAPADIQFMSNSTNATSWEWTFSNGTTSTNENPLVTFNSPGSYDAQLVVEDSYGCSDSIYVADALVISNNTPFDFESSSFNGCAPFAISLHDYSGGIGFWNWNFGDGTTSNISTPSHVYYTPGDYVVSLSTMDSLGCNTHIDTFAIVSVNYLAIDSLTIDMNCDSAEVNFTANCPDCVTGYWNLGDGSDTNAIAVNHQYSGSGPFDIFYIGTSDLGCTGMSLYTIDLDSCTATASGPSGQSPMPGDSGNWVSDSTSTSSEPYNQYCSPITVNVFNPVPNAQNWEWHYGDGHIGYGPTPSHTYDSTGLYSLMLVYNDSLSPSDTLYFHNFINVVGHTNTILVNNSTYCNDEQITLTSADSSLYQFYWSIDNNLSNQNTYTIDTLFSNSNQLHAVTLTTLDSNMCSYSTSAGILTNGVEPQFSFDSVFCMGDSIRIDHQLSSNYQVIFNIGGTIITDTSYYTFTNPGNYPTTVTAVSPNGCSTDFNLGDIVVNGANSAFTMLSSPDLCVGDTIVMSAADPNSDSFNWNLSNVTMISSSANASGIVQNPGTFDITLETTLNGCPSSTTQTDIYMVNQAQADFSYTQDNLCLPISCQFTDLSVSPVSWDWDFGDGTNSQTQSPTHIYAAAPGNQITLTITDINGCSASVTKNSIDIFNAQVGISASSGCAPAPISFSDNSQNPVQWSWNFGDGTTDTTATPTHTYITDGVYDVSLIVTSADGCTDTVVNPAMINIDRVEANFASSVNTGCAPQPAYFTDNSYNAASWHWDFGNGVVSSAPNPIQVYYIGGNYNVELVVESATGCTDTLSSDITIMGPQANFSIVDSIICDGDSLEFMNNSQSATSYAWLFGDGNSSNDVTPSHQYTSSGNYDITLIALDSNGCQHMFSQTQSITIASIPDASFAVSDTVGCNPLPISCSTNSSGSSYQWIINGSPAGNGQSHNTTLNTGQHEVMLIATSIHGCVDSSLIDNIEVHPVYTVSIQPIDPVCETQNSVTVNSSTAMGDWYFEGILNPTNDFDLTNLSPGDYTIVQTIDTYCGDSDSVVLHIDSMITSSIQHDQVVCENDQPFSLVSSSTLGFWSGPGVIDPFNGTVDPGSANHGANTLTYNIINGSCIFVDSMDLIVNRLPDAIFSINNPILCEGSEVSINLPSNEPNTNYTWTFFNGNDTIQSADPAPNMTLPPGNWDINLETVSNGCANTSTLTGFVVFDTIAPNSPNIIRSTVFENEAVLTEWEDPAYGEEKILDFQIWRSTDSLNFSMIGTAEKSLRAYVDYDTDVDNQDYYYLIVPTNVCNVTPETKPMSSSILLKKEVTDGDFVKFNWNEYYKWESGVDYYELQRKNEHGEWETIAIIEGSKNSTIIEHP